MVRFSEQNGKIRKFHTNYLISKDLLKDHNYQVIGNYIKKMFEGEGLSC